MVPGPHREHFWLAKPVGWDSEGWSLKCLVVTIQTPYCLQFNKYTTIAVVTVGTGLCRLVVHSEA